MEQEVLDVEAIERRIRDSFDKQAFMATLGAQLTTVLPGEVGIELPYRSDLTQQHGFLHAGVVTSLVDSACGYAALTVIPPDAGVLTVEFKMNLMAPAAGIRFRATGQVVRAGKTIVVCTGEMRVVGKDKPIAVMQATIMAIRGRAAIVD